MDFKPLNQNLIAVLVVNFCLVITGCGSKSDNGANLSLSVLPSQVIMGPGPASSCLDLKTALASSTAPTSSVTGPLVYFPKVHLDWSSTDHSLIISTIRATFTGTGIAGGKYVYQLTPDDVSALLGASTIPANHFSDSTDPTPTGTRELNRGGISCGLTVGGIPLTNGHSTPSFRAQIKIDLIGTSVSADYTSQDFVEQSVTASAMFTSY